MTMKLTALDKLSVVVLAGLLSTCSQSAPDTATPSATPPTGSPSPAADSIAKISEIQSLPVFVRLLNAAQEQPAKEGMGLQTGETIRTQGQALTQIDLNNGLAFRLAGDAVLKLQPDNRLNLTAGDMITWVQPGKKVQTEIITPTAVAGIRGTTVFVQIPKDPQEGVLFFAWEGSVAVRLSGQTEEVLLKTAEEVRIKPGDRDIRQIRQRVRRMSRAEWRQKRQTDPLLRSFKKAKMTTLPIIDQLKPGQLTVPSPSASPGQQSKGQQIDDRGAGHSKQQAEKPDKPDKAPKPEKPDKAPKSDKALKLRTEPVPAEAPDQNQPDANRDDRAPKPHKDK